MKSYSKIHLTDKLNAPNKPISGITLKSVKTESEVRDSATRNLALAGQSLHRVCSLELVSCWQCQPPQLAPAAGVSVPGTVGVGAVYLSWSHQSLRGCS